MPTLEAMAFGRPSVLEPRSGRRQSEDSAWLPTRRSSSRPPQTTLPLDVVRAWSRLDAALTAYQNDVRRHVGLTALQLYLLQLLGDGSMSLRSLRGQLSVHKATLGQSVKELVRVGLCRVAPSPVDARVRIVTATPRGRALVRSVPLAGPLHLLGSAHAPGTMRKLRRALEDALELFGLVPWAEARRARSDHEAASRQ